MGAQTSMTSWSETFTDWFSHILKGVGDIWNPRSQRMTILQGSSTYGLREMGLEGKVVSKEDLVKANLLWRDKMRADGSSGLTNIANSVAMDVFLDGRGGESEYFFGTRSLKNKHGECFTSLWAFKAWDVLDKNPEANKALIIDIGTGEIKRRLIERIVSEPHNNQFKTTILSDIDGYKFHEMLTHWFKEDDYEKVCYEISNILTNDLEPNLLETQEPGDDGEVFLQQKQIPIYAIGTAGMRNIAEIDQDKIDLVMDVLPTESIARSFGWKPIHLSILSPEEESYGEKQAFLKAYQNATNIPEEARQYDIHGFLSWGNGSLQGGNSDGFITKFTGGLKNIKKRIIELVGEEPEVLNNKNFKLTFGTEQFNMIVNSTGLWLRGEVKCAEKNGEAMVGL